MPSSSLDFRDRPALFATLEVAPYDLLVIGAGITGCGVARDAAMRGLRVALVDAADIAAGTSSRSSKLIHGGMRYLAQGQMSVVREAATERKTLRRIAPHLAQTLPFVVPARSRASLLKFKAGMLAYEQLGEVEAAERHEMWELERLHAEEPLLNTERLRGALVYPEYLTDDARLTLANARSAAAAGAAVATYARVTAIPCESGHAAGATVSGSLPGENLGARIRARLVVNAAGPWLDAVRALEERTAPPLLQLTKGIHVTLARERLPISHTVVMSTPDKRSIFVVPRDRFVYFGTTDTFYAAPDYWPEITRDDIAYLLRCGEAAFNTPPLTDADIVSLWSGVRPLLAQQGKSPSEISRRHEILDGPHGVISIAGGKLTSFRSMAERIVDLCEERLGRERTACVTAQSPLPGGDIAGPIDGVCRQLAGRGLPDHEAARLARLYGAEAQAVAKSGAGAGAEARWAVLREGALMLEDYWVRRSARARFDDNGGMDALAPAAGAMAGLLGWADAETQRQIDVCRDIRRKEMSPVHTEGASRADSHR
jgi:glycerol-3-phosphate dehydrogenase